MTGKLEIPGRKKGPYTFLPSIWDVRDFYEAARAEETKLIQQLVNTLKDARVELISAGPHLPKVGQKLAMKSIDEVEAALSAAAARNFKPTEQP